MTTERSARCEGASDTWAEADRYRKNERRTWIVVAVTAVMMIVEIAFGYWSGSMALLADGWHMATHAGALGISAVAYRLARSARLRSRLSFGTGKILPLAGYTSALLLGLVALFMAIESVRRLLDPISIETGEAIVVAVAGLLVNGVCALLLRDGAHSHSHSHDHGHDHDHDHDHGKDLNLHGAYLHVIADAVTSLLAIGALLGARYGGYAFLDPLVGLVGAFWIGRWAVGLLRESAGELLDRHAGGVDGEEVRAAVEEAGACVLDLHIWRLAPAVVACELVVESPSARGADFYRALVSERFGLHHIVVEERVSGR